MLSKRQRSTEVAFSEKIAKLTPLPSQVAPSGYGYPNQIFTGVIKRACSIPYACRLGNGRRNLTSTRARARARARIEHEQEHDYDYESESYLNRPNQP